MVSEEFKDECRLVNVGLSFAGANVSGRSIGSVECGTTLSEFALDNGWECAAS
jgi:hypothetical protein